MPDMGSISFLTTWDSRPRHAQAYRHGGRYGEAHSRCNALPRSVEGSYFAFTAPTPSPMALASTDNIARPYLWTAPTK